MVTVDGEPSTGPKGLDGEDGVTVRLTAEAARTNLLAVLQLCAANKLRCSEKTRRPTSASVAAVVDALRGGDFYPTEAIAAFAWPLLVQAGGLAELAGGRLQLTARGRMALSRPPHVTIRSLWQRWLSHGMIDEMSRVEQIKGQRSARALTACKPRRNIVAQALARCPQERWVSIDSLFDTMQGQKLQPTVARDPWKLYIADPQYGSLGYQGFGEWPILEGRYTLCVLFEYAGTLGLCDVAYQDPVGARDDFRENWGTDDLDYLSRYDGLRAVRLNALGAYVLGLAETYEPNGHPSPADGSLRVLSNLDIVATGPLLPAERMVLDAYAEQTSDQVWSLRSERLLAAIDAGRRPDELQRFLEGRTQHQLPSTVAAFLADLTVRAERLRDLGVARIVECSDPALAALIVRDRRLRQLCHPIGERHLAIPVEHETEFRKALRALGYVLPPTPEG